MKRFADTLYKNEMKHTNVWEVREIIENDPKRHEETTYYSTHRREKDKKNMAFVNRKPNAFFRYINSGGNKSNHDIQESLTHELCKEIIAETDTLVFLIDNKRLELQVVNSYVEERVIINDTQYRVDVLIEFSQSVPCQVTSKWGGKIAVEIYVEHKTSKVKIKDMYDSKIALIEVNISDKLKIDENRIKSSSDIEQKKQFLKNIFKNGIYAQILSDPSTDEFLILSLNKKNEKLRKEVIRLEKELTYSNDTKAKTKIILEEENITKVKNKQMLNESNIKYDLEKKKRISLEKTLDELGKSLFKRLFFSNKNNV